MTRDISSNDDQIDVRDVIARVEELEEEQSTFEHDDDGNLTNAEWSSACPDEAAELATLSSLLSDLKGYGGDEQWRGDWYPIGLIRDSYFVEAMKELCEDIGDFPNGVPGYYVIDWKATADNLRVDYSSVEFEGVTYWYR